MWLLTLYSVKHVGSHIPISIYTLINMRTISINKEFHFRFYENKNTCLDLYEIYTWCYCLHKAGQLYIK